MQIEYASGMLSLYLLRPLMLVDKWYTPHCPLRPCSKKKKKTRKCSHIVPCRVVTDDYDADDEHRFAPQERKKEPSGERLVHCTDRL